jgi:hypothetical protein
MENEIMENIAEVATEIQVADMPTDVVPTSVGKTYGAAAAAAGVGALAIYGAYNLAKKGLAWVKAKKKARDLDDPLNIPGEGDVK